MLKSSFTLFSTFLIVFISGCVSQNSMMSETVAGANSKTVSFHINYRTAEIAGKTLVFFDSSDYLTEINRPKIPVYIKKFVLSENSILKNISLRKTDSKIYENVFVDIVRDEYYPIENFSGFYPREVFWYNVFELLDERKEIEVGVAGMQYNQETKQAKVYNNIELLIEYEGSIYEKFE